MHSTPQPGSAIHAKHRLIIPIDGQSTAASLRVKPTLHRSTRSITIVGCQARGLGQVVTSTVLDRTSKDNLRFLNLKEDKGVTQSGDVMAMLSLSRLVQTGAEMLGACRVK